MPVEQALVDLFFLILILRVVYIAISKGVLCEIFKAAGLLIASIFSFHYYYILGDYIGKRVSFLNKEYLYFTCFLLILISIWAIFSLLRTIATLLVAKDKEVSFPQRWVSAFIGWGRAIFFSSVVVFLFQQVPFDQKIFKKTISYGMFKKIAPKIYLVTLNLYQKINPKVKVNNEVVKYCKEK